MMYNFGDCYVTRDIELAIKNGTAYCFELRRTVNLEDDDICTFNRVSKRFSEWRDLFTKPYAEIETILNQKNVWYRDKNGKP